MNRKISFQLVVTSLLVLIFSCDDDVTLVNPNNFAPSNFFENTAQLEAAATGAYAALQTRGLYQRNGYVMPDAFSDEAQSGGVPTFNVPFLFQSLPNSEGVEQFWGSCYSGISNCNFILDNEQTILENMANGAGFDQDDVDSALGQGYFLRGLYYFLLVKRYGGVPIVTSNLDAFNKPRSTVDEVYDLIINDLNTATQLLPPKGMTEEGRATRGAALGLLGRVFLQRSMFAEAKVVLDQIEGYSLLPLEQYSDNFNETGEFNDESMFEVIFSNEQDGSQWGLDGTGLGEVTFRGIEYTAWTNLRPSRKLLAEFEDGDPRFDEAILENGEAYGPNDQFTLTGAPPALWYKFSNFHELSINEITAQQFTSVNARILRFADVVLMKAEAENELGNPAMAINYLNQIRSRVEMPLYGTPEMDAAGFPVTNRDEIFRAIVHERFVELCGEQVRFDDLVRWNMDADEITVDDNGNPRGYNPAINRLIPIPQSEIDRNSSIGPGDQNPGF